MNGDALKVSDAGGQVHKTRDIYLTAYCLLQGCTLKIETQVGSERVSFLILADEKVVLKDLVKLYFDNKAVCNPKALKYRITDVKNQLYSVKDNL